jgi:hypothetical protein
MESRRPPFSTKSRNSFASASLCPQVTRASPATSISGIAFLEQRVGSKLPTRILFDPDFKTIEGIARLLGAG